MKTRRSRTASALLVCLALALLLAPTSASAPPSRTIPPGTSSDTHTTPQLIEAALARGEIDQDTANLYLAYALVDHEKLPARYHGNAPWDGTLPLLGLQEAVRTMRVGPTRTTIEQLMQGTCGSSSGSMSNSTSSTYFYTEYNTIAGGLTIGSYTTSLDTAWATEVGSFGWAAPPVSSSPPPGSLYHVRIDSLGGGLYGYVTTSGVHAGFVGNNPNTAWNDGEAYATCMVLNNDYSGFPGTEQQALDATTAHEFNHSIQFGYGGLTGANTPDMVFIEGGATWMEDEVFDAADDNYNYLWPTFSMCMGEYTDSPYPYWITFRSMTERYGTGAAGGSEQVMQDFWEETSKGTGDNLSAISTALANQGTTLADAYHAYAIAVKFNKTCGGSYVLPYCFEEAAGYVGTAGATLVHGSIASAGLNYTGAISDNYALNWISLPASGDPYTVTLQNTSGGGQLRGSVVCDTGSALNVNALPSVVGAHNSSSLTDFDPSGCSSVVAVVTNQAQTANNPTSCTDRSYMLRTDGGEDGEDRYFVYLPLIMRCYPLVARMNPINNPDGDGIYTVSWSWSSCGTSPSYYQLQADTDPLFGSPTSFTEYSTSFDAYSSAPGTYYWRVRANMPGSGWTDWSNTASVTVGNFAYVWVDNDTGGNLTVEIVGVEKRDFSTGTHYWRSIPSGTYTYKAWARCGKGTWSDYFSGEVVLSFWCGYRAVAEETMLLGDHTVYRSSAVQAFSSAR